MRIITVKLFSLRQYIKHHSFIALRPVSALAQLKPFSSDSDSDTGAQNRCKVVETLNSLRRKPYDALSYFDKLKKEEGFLHDVCTYAAIVRILCSCRLNKELDLIFLQVIRKENKIDFEVVDLLAALYHDGSNSFVRVSNAMAKAYVVLGMFDQVLEILLQTEHHGFDFSILTYNFFMNQLVHCGKLDMALAVYQQLERLGLSSVYTYVIVLKTLFKKGCLEEADEVSDKMYKAEVTPHEFSYSTLIEGFCLNGRLDWGYQYLRALAAAKIPLGAFAYTVVIRGFCDENRLEEAEGLLLYMETQGVVPDVYVYSALISGYCKFGNINKALALRDEMVSKDIKPDCVVENLILKCYCQLGRVYEAMLQLKEVEEHGIVDNISYNVVVDALCKLGKVDKAMELFSEMKDKQMNLDVVNYTTMIYGYCLQGKLVDALTLFEEMKGKGHEPDLVTYKILTVGLGRCNYGQLAIDLLKNQGFTPNFARDNVIIEGLCMGGRVKDAESFFHSLQDKCPENYSAMFNGYCHADDSEKAFKLFMSLSSQELSVSKGSIFKLLNSLCIKGDNAKALILFKRMHTLNLEPSKIMYSKLIGAFCQAGEMVNAQWVFDILISRGIVPNLMTYTVMINGYLKVNCMAKAFQLYNDMKRQGIRPDAVIHKLLFTSKLNLKGCSFL